MIRVKWVKVNLIAKLTLALQIFFHGKAKSRWVLSPLSQWLGSWIVKFMHLTRLRTVKEFLKRWMKDVHYLLFIILIIKSNFLKFMKNRISCSYFFVDTFWWDWFLTMKCFSLSLSLYICIILFRECLSPLALYATLLCVCFILANDYDISL